MSATVDASSAGVLAEVLPGGRVRDISLVVGSALFLGVVGNVSVPLPFTPVPLSLATFAVLITGASLGPVRATSGVSLYLLAGVAGVPWFAERTSGWSFPSFGYIVGYVFAAALVGALARKGADRRAWSTALAMTAGSLVIYTFGVTWLMASLDIGLAQGLALGAAPFLVGDTIKLALATAALPTAWRLVEGPR